MQKDGSTAQATAQAQAQGIGILGQQAATCDSSGGRHKTHSTTQLYLHFFGGMALTSVVCGMVLQSPWVVGVSVGTLGCIAALCSANPSHQPTPPNGAHLEPSHAPDHTAVTPIITDQEGTVLVGVTRAYKNGKLLEQATWQPAPEQPAQLEAHYRAHGFLGAK
jgi:hypothetical protein